MRIDSRPDERASLPERVAAANALSVLNAGGVELGYRDLSHLQAGADPSEFKV